MKTILLTLALLLTTNLSAAATNAEKESFKKACEAGNSIACYNMGLLYEKGDGATLQNHTTALEFYTQSCEKNYYKACTKAAFLYEEGKNIKQDMKEALKLYTKACGGNDGQACHNVAVYYSKSESEALRNFSIQIYDKACNNRWADSCVKMGNYYRDSNTLMRDYKMAKIKYDLACDMKNHTGCKEVRILKGLGY